jgi:hypothetical protein
MDKSKHPESDLYVFVRVTKLDKVVGFIGVESGRKFITFTSAFS